MKTHYAHFVCGSLAVGIGLVCCAAAGEVPFSAIRLRKPQTDRPEVWTATLGEFAKYRAGVDEVWFSTGICFPNMAEHRASAKRLASAAVDLRKLGILPSLQIQATIGHGDSLMHYADNSAQTWQRYVSADGSTAESLNCFRAPDFLAYMREMATLYAAEIRPYAVWIDDDIRIVNHGGPGFGCHCEGCLAAFAAEEGRKRSREELVAEIKKDAALAARWRAFSFKGEAELVRTIAEAVHIVSPETRMCMQQPGICHPEHRMLYEACHAATGLPVGMRPGAGAYFDHDARAQIGKAYYLARQIDTIGRLPFIDRICPEIETCPRSFACRTGRGVLLEALEAMSQGMNSISALAIDAGFETPEWYGEEILRPLARNAAMLKRYVNLSDGTERCGYGVSGSPSSALQTGSLPLKPLVKGASSTLAHIVTEEVAQDAVKSGADALDALLSEDLLIDGEAAEVLFKAGRGADIGIAGCEKVAGSLRERFVEDTLNAGFKARETPVSGKAFFLKPSEGAKAVSGYYSDANAGFWSEAATVVFENKNGLRRVVFGHDAFSGALKVASGDRIMQLHRLADWASHGKSPVLVETPTRSFVQPRVRQDGSLASVVFVNASIGETAPVKLRLRGVPAAAKKAVWSSFDADDVALDVVRDGADALVALPSVSAWTGGYLFFEGAAEPVPAFIFGQNLEHTRSAVQGGISAQLVRNRKFAGKPSRKGVSMMWEPYGSRAVYDRASFGCTRHAVKSRMHRINEIGCQVIGSLDPDGEAGIRQEGIGVRGGVKHTFKAVVSSWNPEDTTMALRVTAAGGRVLAERDFTVNTKTRKDWTRIALDFTSDKDETVAISVGVKGRRYCAVGAVSVMPDDNFRGMRSDVVRNLREIGATVIRWPGGNFAGEYRWRDGLIADPDERAPLQSFTEIETQPYSGGYDSNDIGMEDVIALCAEIGAEPFFTINAAWESPEDSAEWVRTCRGRVKLWSLGNEIGYAHMEGPKGPDGYVAMVRPHAEAMLKADPTIRLVASGNYPWGGKTWIDGAAKPLSDIVPTISYHRYDQPGVPDYSTPEGTEAFYAKLSSAVDMAFDNLAKFRKLLPTKIAISYDEWNLWQQWYREEGVADGLYAAKFLGRMMRTWRRDGIGMVCYFQPVNEQAICVSPFESHLTSIGEAMRLAKGHVGGVPAEIEGLPDNAFVTDAADGSRYMTFYNFSASKPCAFRIPTGGRGKILCAETLVPNGLEVGSRYVRRQGAGVVDGGDYVVELGPAEQACVRSPRHLARV